MLAEDWFENQEGRPATLLGASLDMSMARIQQGSHATKSQYALTRSTEMPPPATTPYAALVHMVHVAAPSCRVSKRVGRAHC